MNILIPDSWLREHLETNAEPATIQEQLSLCGPSVEHITTDAAGEAIYDIEVTTNRVDSMSVRGLAREAAVILTNAGWASHLKPLNAPEIQASEADRLPLPEIQNNPLLCERIFAVVLENVEHRETPNWMQRRLEQVGLNTKDVVIDITNYVSHELGHPCHAFDYDKVMNLGGHIIVKQAEPGQLFTTLDGGEHTAIGGEVVFVNGKNEIIDLPGIMGTANTAVSNDTTRVLFWIESIPAQYIRMASMSHGLRTPAAQLNERNLDPNLGRDVLQRAVALYQELTGAHVASPVLNIQDSYRPQATLNLTVHELERYLGFTVPAQTVEHILQQLEFGVTRNGEDAWTVTIPSFRTDVSIPVDLVEEVARILGYHTLPSTLMPTSIPTNRPSHTNFSVEDQVKQLLADRGYQELYTYSLVGEELLQAAHLHTEDHLAVRNPLTQDMVWLRRSLVPSHLSTLREREQQWTARGSFELANVYHPDPQKKELPKEKLMLVIMERDIRALRTTLEFLFSSLYLERWSTKKSEDNTKIDDQIRSFFKSSAIITQQDRVLGTIGYLESDPQGLAAAELDWSMLLEARRPWPEYHSLARTSIYREDWTVEIAKGVTVEEVMQHIRAASEFITSVRLIDTYEREIVTNATFRIEFLDAGEQFTAERAKEVRDRYNARA